jgi:hypothetical protein
MEMPSPCTAPESIELKKGKLPLRQKGSKRGASGDFASTLRRRMVLRLTARLKDEPGIPCEEHVRSPLFGCRHHVLKGVPTRVPIPGFAV